MKRLLPNYRHSLNSCLGFYGIFAATCYMIISLTSCSDKDNLLPELKSENYTSRSLALTYNGEEMPGKSVSLKISGAGSPLTEVEMTLYSEFDLSQLSGMGLTGSVAGPGIIPGSPELTLPVTLQPDGGSYIFSGNGTSDYADFKYSGRLSSDKLELNITDATLKSQTLAGKVFTPAPIERDGLLKYKSLPFHLVWEIDPSADIDIPLSQILQAIATAPVIPVYNNTAYSSIAQLFYSDIKSIALTPGGNIPMMYISTVGGAARIATTCGNMLQYVPTPGGMKLYVNPLSAVSQVLLALSKPSADAEFVTKADSSDVGQAIEIDPQIKIALLQALMTTIKPQLSQGIPLTITPGENGADIYFDTAASVTFLSSLMENILSNPRIATALQEYLASLDIPSLSQEEINAILTQLPTFLEKTTKLEIGLSLRYKE